ncbi:Uncharacterised protein [Mycobacteroides abscessus subsp. abscessus]|nr:Uncharacterised protein [Mycobacteroides abscessus subsp. abscessus]
MALKSWTLTHTGSRLVPSTVLPARNESKAAGDEEQNPGPLSAMTMTLPSYPNSLPTANATNSPTRDRWKTRFPNSRR